MLLEQPTPVSKVNMKKRNNCIECDKELSMNPTAKRCPSCRSKMIHSTKTMRLRHRLLTLKQWNGKRKPKSICSICHVELFDRRSKLCLVCILLQRKTNKKHKYCMDCNVEIKGYTAKRCKSCSSKGINNPAYKDGATLKKYYCKCGREIYYKVVKYGKGRCYKCYDKRDKNNPNYVHGKAREPYSLEFNNFLKESIRKRDNYMCQNCGMTEEEHLIVIGTNLHIHHIDYNKKNCKKYNLISTCQSCNVRANFNRVYWQDMYTKKIRSKERVL